MSEENETQEESNGLIRSLRQSIKERDRELDEMRDQIEELQAQLEQGMPEPVSTPEVDDEAEESEGAEPVQEAPQEQSTGMSPADVQRLASVSALSNQVAAAARGDVGPDPSQAQTPEELVEITKKLGIYQETHG